MSGLYHTPGAQSQTKTKFALFSVEGRNTESFKTRFHTIRKPLNSNAETRAEKCQG